jgi:hypothetical protein
MCGTGFSQEEANFGSINCAVQRLILIVSTHWV